MGEPMRSFLNGILVFIGAATLSDEEYDGLNFTGLEVNVYNQAAYDQLAGVLLARESISTLHDNLIALFKIRGLAVEPAKVGKSTIYLGSVLE
jgi:hypothetical protein